MHGVTIPSSNLKQEVKLWCEDNLISVPTISINFIENVRTITLVNFSSENDAILFKMRWL